MQTRYAHDDLVYTLMSKYAGRTGAQHIYKIDEALADYDAIVDDANWIIDALVNVLSIQANISFAVAGGLAGPFRAMHVELDDFVILIDRRAYYYLLTLCLRLQSLPPLAEATKSPEIAEERTYRGKYLLDITKDIVFHTEDPTYLLHPNQPKSVFKAAFAYILAHEVAHISHGHIEFKKTSEFAELCASKEDRSLTLKALEMDADCSATTSDFSVFERLLKYSLENKRIPENISEQEFAGGFRKCYILGMYIAHIYHDTLANNSAPENYPIGYARFLTTVDVLRTVYLKHIPDSVHLLNEIRDLLVECFVRLSGSLQNLRHPIATNICQFDSDVQTHIYDPVGEVITLGQLTPLHGRWSRIRPYLEKVQRGGVLAPATAEPR